MEANFPNFTEQINGFSPNSAGYNQLAHRQDAGADEVSHSCVGTAQVVSVVHPFPSQLREAAMSLTEKLAQYGMTEREDSHAAY